MALRNFDVKLATSATGSSLIKETNPQRGLTLKGIIGGTGCSVTAGSNDITIALDGTETSTFYDSNFSVVDEADVTKKVVVSAGGITTTKTATLTFANALDATYTFPSATGTLAALNAAQTWTGVQTFGGNINSDIKRCSAQLDKTDTTLTNITGLTGFTLVAGATYKFEYVLKVTCGGTGGTKVAFKYTTATVSAIDYTTLGFTASAVAVANGTTTTDQATHIASNTAAILIEGRGTIVVGTGGTLDLQFAENSANSTSSVLVGSTMHLTRIA